MILPALHSGADNRRRFRRCICGHRRERHFRLISDCSLDWQVAQAVHEIVSDGLLVK